MEKVTWVLHLGNVVGFQPGIVFPKLFVHWHILRDLFPDT